MVGKVRPQKIIMPSELTGKKRAPRRSGPVIRYRLGELTESPANLTEEENSMEQMLEEIEDFKDLDKEQQRKILLELVRDGQNDEDIGERFGMTRWQIRNLRYKHGIKKDRTGHVRLQPDDKDDKKGTAPRERNGAGTEGLAVMISARHPSEELANRLGGIRSLLLAENGERQYEIELRLREVRKDKRKGQR